MKKFKSPAAFAAHLVTLASSSHEVMHHVVKESAEDIKDTAQGMVGFYQDSIGPYPKWEDLADSTEYEKARLGYSVDAPLLRTGEMKQSIGSKTQGLEAVVGSSDPVIAYHEFGTDRMPPRPVFGPAAMHARPRITTLVGRTTVAWLSGIGWLHPRALK